MFEFPVVLSNFLFYFSIVLYFVFYHLPILNDILIQSSNDYSYKRGYSEFDDQFYPIRYIKYVKRNCSFKCMMGASHKKASVVQIHTFFSSGDTRQLVDTSCIHLRFSLTESKKLFGFKPIIILTDSNRENQATR